ncbi:hypothetical protein AYI68_g5079 [Smittium mucronatum]|uniref:Uncharacterized protein n=1 Tax=Smittium mucronatum TaxID=133383 RepID=A0A1R0GVA9_9FUNG|nr:hypothetical protein AYI68_g5079 [Smittium mucronatum]
MKNVPYKYIPFLWSKGQSLLVLRDLRAGITPLLRLSALRTLLPELTTPIVFTDPTVEIIGKNLISWLGPELG